MDAPFCRKHGIFKVAVAHYYCEECAKTGEAMVGPSGLHEHEQLPPVVVDMTQICERCQMRLHENMGTFLPGIRGSMAWRCAVCHPIEGSSGSLKREEVVRLRKLKWQSEAK